MTRSTSDRSSAASGSAATAPRPRRRGIERPARAVAPSRIARRPALRPEYDEPERRSWFDWGYGLSKAERERVKERVALIALSSVLVVAVLLIGGLLGWDRLVVARRAVAVVDGHSFMLSEYANTMAYKQNVLMANLDQARSLMNQPGDPSSNPFAQMAAQQAGQIQQQLMNLPTQHLEEMIDDYLIRLEAKKRGIAVSASELDEELKKIVGYQDPNATPVPEPTVQATVAPTPAEGEAAVTQPTAAPTSQPTAQATATTRAAPRRQDTFQTQYKNYLRLTAGSDSIARQDAETQVLRRKLNEQMSTDVPKTQQQVHARHILVPDETAAQTVLQRLRNGEAFDALAAELSTDTSNKDKGGDLGWFPRGIMVSDFEEAAFKLQPGQVSDPVKTQFGYHIVKVDEREAAREVDPQMYDSIKNGALSRWLDTEKKNHSVARYLDSDKQEWAMTHAPKPRALSRG